MTVETEEQRLQEQAFAIASQETMEKYARYRVFQPNVKQEEVIDCLGRCDPRKVNVIVFSAGNGVGKTCTGPNILANILFNPMAPAFRENKGARDFIRAFRERPKPWVGRICADKEGASKVVVPEIKKWFPKDLYKADKEGRHFESSWTDASGGGEWRFGLLTYDQETRQYEGETVDVAWLDEPPPYDKYAATVARFRRGGLIIITMTPLTSAAWIYDTLLCEQAQEEQKGNAQVVFGSIEDNCKEHGQGKGLLDHDTIVSMIENYDADEKEARISGKFAHLSGLIYKGVEHKIHRVPDRAPPPDAQIVQIVDPHDNKPWAMCWIMLTPDDHAQVFAEYPVEPFHKMRGARMSLDDYASITRTVEARLGIANRMRLRIMDPNFGESPKATTGTTVRDDMERKHGLIYDTRVNDDIQTGHEKVRQLLKYDSWAGSRPRLTIQQSCYNTWYGLTHYSFRDARWEEGQGLTNIVNKDYKDFPDLLRYFAVKGVRYEERVPVRRVKPHLSGIADG